MAFRKLEFKKIIERNLIFILQDQIELFYTNIYRIDGLFHFKKYFLAITHFRKERNLVNIHDCIIQRERDLGYNN